MTCRCITISGTIDALADNLSVVFSLEGLLILRYLFGIPSDPSDSLESSGESLKRLHHS